MKYKLISITLISLMSSAVMASPTFSLTNLPSSATPSAPPPAYQTWSGNTTFWISSVNGINNNGTVVGQLYDSVNSWGFVGATPIEYGDFSKDGTSSIFTVGVTSINNNGGFIGNQNSSGYGASGEFYASTANSTTPDFGAINSVGASPNFAGVTDSGIVYGTATPMRGEGYTYLFAYNTITKTFTKHDLPFVDSSAVGTSTENRNYCYLAPADLSVQATAVSSDGKWVVGNYQIGSTNESGNFSYDIKAKAFNKFNIVEGNSSPAITAYTITGVNKNGIAVGGYTLATCPTPTEQNNNAPCGSGFIYDVKNKATVATNLQDTINPLVQSTSLQGINDHGVIVGQSNQGNQPCGINELCAGNSYFWTATYK